MTGMPTLLWWGRCDPQYSRNQIILATLAELGWRVDFFHPVASPLGKAQAFFQRPERPDLVWVPCFRQRDVPGAAYWARKWKCPLVFDPLISAYQKEVQEKGKWKEQSARARQLKKWEAGLFHHADVVIADTPVHARFYVETFRIDPRKVSVVHVGADEGLFHATDVAVDRSNLEVLFYGSFLALQGPGVIIDAAAAMADPKIRWVLLGDGDLKPVLMAKARGIPNVSFEPWISYDRLPQRMAQAQILLGIFGNTPKAAMVIPNKAFQAMAAGRPLITRSCEAYPEQMRENRSIGWVPPGDSRALVDCVRRWVAEPEGLIEKGRQARRLYEQFFSKDCITMELKSALAGVTASR